MQGACYIVAPNGVLDPLPAATDPREVFDQGPLHRIQLKNGWNLLWTSAGYHLAEVNQLASCLARELVKGDACLIQASSSGSSSAHPADDLLANWPGQGLNNPRYSWDAWAKALHLPASHGHPASPSARPHSSTTTSTTTSSSSSATSHSPCSCTRRSHRTRTAHAVHARIMGRRLMSHVAASASAVAVAAEGAGTTASRDSSSSCSSSGGGGDMSQLTWPHVTSPRSSLHSGNHGQRQQQQQQRQQAPPLRHPSAAHAAAGAHVAAGALPDRSGVTWSPSALQQQEQGHSVGRGYPSPSAAGSGAGSGCSSFKPAPPCVVTTPGACGLGGVLPPGGCPTATASPAGAAADPAGVSGLEPLGGVHLESPAACVTQPQAAGAGHFFSQGMTPTLLAAAAAGGGAGGSGVAAHAVQANSGAGVAAAVQLLSGAGEEHLSHVSSSSSRSSMEVELLPGCSPGCGLLAPHDGSSTSTSEAAAVASGTYGEGVAALDTAAAVVETGPSPACTLTSSSSSSSRATTSSDTTTSSSSRVQVSCGPTLAELWASSAAPWEDLAPEVMGAIVTALGQQAAEVLPLYASSRCWQEAMLRDQALLRSLVFTLREPSQPLAGGHPRAGQALGAWLRGVGDLPRLLLQAKQAHNVSANACCAQLLEAAGQPDLAMPCWQRCAKAGHLEGQLRYGLALYRGMCGVVQDAEAAFMYLSRAVKQVQGNSSSSSSSSSTDGGNSSRVREAEAAAPPAPVPASSSSMVSSPGAAAAAPPGVQQTGLAAEVLRQAGVVLGYLHFDGEGTRSDRQEATRLFKMASDYGSKEAQQVLGWIFNTGQYG